LATTSAIRSLVGVADKSGAGNREAPPLEIGVQLVPFGVTDGLVPRCSASSDLKVI
jgi:hypothetical protein